MLRGLFVRFMSLYLRVCVAYHVQSDTWCLMPVLQVIFPTTLSAYTIASFLALLGATLYCREVCLAAAVFVFIWAWVGLSVCLSASLTVRKLLKKY